MASLGFSTQIFETATSDFRNFKLLKPVDFFAKDGRHYRLPFCAPSDLASTPKEIWGAPLFLIPCGWYAIPAYGHDCGFQNTLQIVMSDGTVMLAALTEAECNDLLLEMMQTIKPNPTPFEKLQMDAIYEGVTIGGWHAFKEDRSA